MSNIDFNYSKDTNKYNNYENTDQVCTTVQ